LYHNVLEEIHGSFSCRVEEYLPNLAAEIEKASLVISHAGAGSIFESLLFRVPLVVVPNPILMGNHQVELADLMDQLRHAVCVLPQETLSMTAFTYVP
jgi:beta-1,4-N-acetylglucosaminyltransferase